MKPFAFALIAIAGLCAPAVALEWGFESRAGYTFSDNVAQAPDNDVASIISAELTGQVEHVGQRLSLDAQAGLIQREFLNGNYGSESQPQLRGDLAWWLLPDRLRLDMADTYGQLALNPSQGLLPSEYEDANVFTAGPSLLVPMGGSTTMMLRGEYRNSKFLDSNLGTERKLGELTFEHELSRLISLTANAGYSRSDFSVEGETRNGYNVVSGGLGVNAVGRTGALFVNGGVDQLRADGDSFNGFTYEVAYEHRLSRRGRLYLTANREIADAADVFSLSQVSDPVLGGIRDVQVVAQPMQRDGFRASYVWGGRKLNFEIGGGHRKENFDVVDQDPVVTDGQDRKINEFRLGAGYSLGEYTQLHAVAEALRERFANGLRSNDLLFSLNIGRRVTDKVRLEIEGQRIERSDSPRDFDELRAFIALRFTLRPLPREGQAAVFDRAFEQRLERARGQPEDDAR